MPAAAQAATTGSPYRAYGPTVEATTRVAAAICSTDAGSSTSAVSSGHAAAVRPEPVPDGREALGGPPGQADPHRRPARLAARCRGDEPPDEAGRTEDDDVQGAGRRG